MFWSSFENPRAVHEAVMPNHREYLLLEQIKLSHKTRLSDILVFLSIYYRSVKKFDTRTIPPNP